MDKRKKILLIVGIIVLNIFMICSIYFIVRATMENKLRNEVNNLAKLDITKDRYNTKIKTIGKYAVVEKAIKEYLDEDAVSLQKVLAIMNDEKLSKLLSYDNYKSDGPEFKTSLDYITTNKETFNKEIDNLINNLDDENIKKYIRTKTKDKYYINLYDELMLSSKFTKEFNNTKSMLENTKTHVNNIFDTSSEVLNFLVLYKDDWVLEDNQIKFRKQEQYNYYMELVSKVNNKQ